MQPTTATTIVTVNVTINLASLKIVLAHSIRKFLITVFINQINYFVGLGQISFQLVIVVATNY